MIEFEEACQLIFENTNKLGEDERSIENAIGWVLAEDIISPLDVAPFRNSAMDGFAVKSQWLKECSTYKPVEIPIGSTAFAGDSSPADTTDDTVLKVMTGAPVPDNFDAVVPFEDTVYDDSKVRFSKPAVAGQHIRPSGEDIVRGQKLYDTGTTLKRLDIGILATIGLPTVSVYRKPSIMIVSTGNELTDPGEKLAGNKIYDANSYTILSLVEPFCGETERISCIRDEEEEIEKLLNSPHDVIVFSGGVSAGERDLVVDLAEKCGWRKIFHKARIKPGKPIYFATRGNQLLLGLPGNPLSVAVTCSVFLIPALKKIGGFKNYRLQPQPVTLAPEIVRRPNRKLIWPGFVKQEADGTYARYSPKKSSAALTSLLNTDGLIIQDTVDAGSGDIIVDFIPWSQILG